MKFETISFFSPEGTGHTEASLIFIPDNFGEIVNITRQIDKLGEKDSLIHAHIENERLVIKFGSGMYVHIIKKLQAEIAELKNESP